MLPFFISYSAAHWILTQEPEKHAQSAPIVSVEELLMSKDYIHLTAERKKDWLKEQLLMKDDAIKMVIHLLNISKNICRFDHLYETGLIF